MNKEKVPTNEDLRSKLFVFLARHHNEAISFVAERNNTMARFEELLVVVLDENSLRDLEFGSPVDPGWGGEGAICIKYQDGNIECFGGEAMLGGVPDNYIHEIYKPILSEDDISFLEKVDPNIREKL